MIENGKKISKSKYIESLSLQSDYSTLFNNWIDQNYDYILTPATSTPAPYGLNYNDSPDSTLIFTTFGAPILTIPKFMTNNGLPLGFQLISKKYNDFSIINFAKLLKKYKIISDAIPIELNN